jgi:hypothetical protein
VFIIVIFLLSARGAQMGGTSLLAGRLMARVRAATGATAGLAATAVFTHRTVRALASALSATLPPLPPLPPPPLPPPPLPPLPPLSPRSPPPAAASPAATPPTPLGSKRARRPRPSPAAQRPNSDGEWPPPPPGGSFAEAEALSGATCAVGDGSFDLDHAAELNPFAMATQLLPLLLFGPAKRVLAWTVVASLWVAFAHALESFGVRGARLLALLAALAAGKLFVAGLLLPLAGLAGKWVVVGRYRPGQHPPWGFYFLRWWLVDQWLDVCGRGLFAATPAGLRCGPSG